MGRKGTKKLRQQAADQYRAELRVAIDDALRAAPRRYRTLQFFAVNLRLRRVPLLGWLLERARVKSYEKRVKPRVRVAALMVEGGLPRRYRRALRGDAMAPSVRSDV